MELVKILKYVEKSYEEKPSFLLLMSDNKEYISNGCVFVENTERNTQYLKNKYECEFEIEELFNNPVLENYDSITSTKAMFWGAEALTKVELVLPNALYVENMFAWCMSLKEISLEAPKLKETVCMCIFCRNLKQISVKAPNVTFTHSMLHKCNTLRKENINVNFYLDERTYL